MGQQNKINIGSKKFTESIILADILKVYTINNYPNTQVEHKKQLGSTRILWNALINGQIDVYPEYTGTLEQELIPKNYKTKEEISDYLNSMNIGIGYYLGFNNTYAIGVTKDFAKKFDVYSISDLKKIKKVKYAFTEEFLNRSDGWSELTKHYGILSEKLKSIDHDIAYRALINGDVDAIDLYSTDAEIKYYNLITLKDDLNFFKKYEAIYLYNKHNTIVTKVMKDLNFKISEGAMIQMNFDVKFQHSDEIDTAYKFLNLKKQSKAINNSYFSDMLRYSYEHLWIVSIALIFGIPLGVFLGVASHYFSILRLPIVYSVSFFQTIPSIAFLVLLIGPLNLVGLNSIGNTPAIITLFFYSLMPTTTTTINALGSIPKNYTDIAEILNLSFLKKLFRVKFPLSSLEILNSLKNTIIATLGSATLGALVGAGGLGQPILSGIRLDNYSLILMGVLPAIVMIITTHFLFKIFENIFVSKGLKI